MSIPNHKSYRVEDAEQSLAWMFGFGGGLPLVVLIIWLITTRASAHKWHVTLLGLFFRYADTETISADFSDQRPHSLIFTSFITDVIKNEVGRPRPDLLSRCKPEAGTPEHSLVNIEVCTDPNYAKLQDGWRSFPSGHSSFAFSGLGFLALWLSGQLHVFRPYADLLKGLLALSPLLGAALIAISRCEDYRHDVYDVTVGSALGMTVAFFSYRRYFPRLTNMKCHEPLPSMADGKGVFDKVKLDEETGLQSANAFELDDLNSDEEP